MSDSITAERVTVSLTPKASQALAAVAGREHLSKTAVINRALQLYGYVSRLGSQGGELLAREPGAEDVQRVLLL